MTGQLKTEEPIVRSNNFGLKLCLGIIGLLAFTLFGFSSLPGPKKSTDLVICFNQSESRRSPNVILRCKMNNGTKSPDRGPDGNKISIFQFSDRSRAPNWKCQVDCKASAQFARSRCPYPTKGYYTTMRGFNSDQSCGKTNLMTLVQTDDTEFTLNRLDSLKFRADCTNPANPEIDWGIDEQNGQSSISSIQNLTLSEWKTTTAYFIELSEPCVQK